MKRNITIFILSITFMLIIIFAFAHSFIHSHNKKAVIRLSMTRKCVLIYDSFESGGIDCKLWRNEFSSQAYSCKIVNTIAAKGKHSLRMELHKNDEIVAGSKRSEITLKSEKKLEEHWYSVDVFLPSCQSEKYEADKSPEAIMQWHNTPDPGEEWTSPPLSLGTIKGLYYIEHLWDDSTRSTNAEISTKGNLKYYYLGSCSNDLGKWVSWVFHVKWGWLKSQHPILEVYKDGIQVLNCNGLPNTTNDEYGVYWKIGIYKWSWKDNLEFSKINKRVVYYDNVSVR